MEHLLFLSVNLSIVLVVNQNLKIMRNLLLLTILIVSASQVYSQQHIISGYVRGQDGNPVPSATVRSNLGNVVTQTDENGQFKISATGNAVLSISSVGYEPQEVDVKGRSNVNITLTLNSKALNEVVVTALGIVRQQEALDIQQPRLKPGISFNQDHSTS